MKIKLTTEQQVIDKIDQYLGEITKLKEEIVGWDHLAVQLRDTIEAYRIPKIRETGDKMAGRISWRLARLETLKQSLSAMRTMPLDFNGKNNLDVPAPVVQVEIEEEPS